MPSEESTDSKQEKQPKKVAAVSKSKKSPSGPPVPQLVMKIVVANKERKGVSLAALKKALESGGYDVKKRNNFLKQAVRRLEEKGMFLQPQQQQFAKIAVKKTAVTKVKKPAVKKRSSAGKLKKSAAASKKGKSAKSAKEPAAAAKKPAKSAKMAIVAKTQKKALKPKPV
nr:PREDICTED: histone H1-like [Latimeria chalumnae]|eukprot:XP_014339682.1 PREDICTED: histone H1-like [Latimeria chalumnae]